MATGFDEIGKTLRQLGRDTVSSVQKMNEARQASGRLSDARKTVDRLYAELGKAVYEQYGSAPLAGLEEQLEKITEAKKTVELREKEVQAVKGVAICPNCGKEAAKGEKFCSACGTKLPEIEIPETQEETEQEAEAAEETVQTETVDAAAPETEAPETEPAETEEAETEAVTQENAESADAEASETVEADAETVETAEPEDAGEKDTAAAGEAGPAPETEEAAEAAQSKMEQAGKLFENAVSNIDTDKLKEDMKAAGQAAGDFVNDAADKAKVLFDNVAEKAGYFMQGVNTRLAEREAAKKEEQAQAEAAEQAGEADDSADWLFEKEETAEPAASGEDADTASSDQPVADTETEAPTGEDTQV